MKTDRCNMTQPSDWLEAFKAQAKKENVSFSEWIGDCGLAFLPDDVKRNLSERQPAHRPRSD